MRARLALLPAILFAAALAATTLVAGILLPAAPAAAETGSPGAPPEPPCAAGAQPWPAYAPPDAPPAVMTWTDIQLAGRADCLGAVAGRMNVVAVLAGSFRHPAGADGTLDDLAARFGAVSATVRTLYWSTTDGRWRRLIDDASALQRPDTDARRGDFTAAELRSGQPLYVAQDDTRSTGTNLYRMTALLSGPEKLVVEIVNESTISFLLVPLFDPGGLVTLHVVEDLGGGLWGYYGLTAVRAGSVAGHEKSLVNRAAAFYRFLRGVPGDAAPPLAR
ncbi:MAG: hypothetical protein Kow00114_40650 [Kiloniellaceae bacterium]